MPQPRDKSTEGESWEPKPLPMDDIIFPRAPGLPKHGFYPTEPVLAIHQKPWDGWRIVSEAFKRNNIFASDIANDAFIKSIRQSEADSVSARIDPFEISPYATIYPLQYSGLTTVESVLRTDSKIREEILAQQIIHSNGWWATVGILGAAITDPLQVAIPFGTLKTGIGFSRGFKRAATPTYFATLVDEIILSSHQPTRTQEESAAVIGFSSVMVGVMGGFAGQFGSKYVKRISQRYLDDMDNYERGGGIGGINKDPPSGPNRGRTVHEGADDTRPIYKGVGAAAKDEGFAGPSPREQREAEALSPAFGLERLPDVPYKRLMYSPLTITREYTAALIESPGLYQNKNFGLVASTLSVETLIRPWFYGLVETLNYTDDQFAAYRSYKLRPGASGRVIGLAHLASRDALGRTDKMNYAEFREQVSIALRNNEVHENPFVQKASANARKILNKLRDEAIEHELFTAHLRSKVMRLQDKIEAIDIDIKGLRDLIAKELAAIAKLEKMVDMGATVRAAKNKIASLKADLHQMKNDKRKEIRKQKKQEAEIIRINEEGPTVFNEGGYLPRIWRIDKIEANMERFREVIGGYLLKNGVLPKNIDMEVNNMVERIRRDHDFGALTDDNPGIARSARGRLIEMEDKDLFEFIENDYETILRSHVRTFSTDLELVKRFGTVDMYVQIKDMKKAGQEYIASLPKAKQAKARTIIERNDIDFEALRDRLRGTYGLPDDPYRLLSRFYRVMKQWNYITMLGGVVLSALPDLARPIMTEGFHRTFGTSYALLQHSPHIRAMSAKETHRAGTGHDMVLNTRALEMADMWGDVFGRQTGIEKALHRGAEAFSMLNLLNPWNAAIKEWTGAIVSSRIFESSDLFSRTNMEDFFPKAKDFVPGTWGWHRGLFPKELMERGSFRTGKAANLRGFIINADDFRSTSMSANQNPIFENVHYLIPEKGAAKFFTGGIGMDTKSVDTFMENPYVIESKGKTNAISDKDFLDLLKKYNIPKENFDISEQALKLLKDHQYNINIGTYVDPLSVKNSKALKISAERILYQDLQELYFYHDKQRLDNGLRLQMKLMEDGYDGLIIDIGRTEKRIREDAKPPFPVSNVESIDAASIRNQIRLWERPLVNRVFDTNQAIFFKGVPKKLNIKPGPGRKIPHDYVKLARSGIDHPMAQRIMKEFYKYGDIAHKDGTLMRDILRNAKAEDLDALIAAHIARARKEGGVFLANTDAWTDLDAVMHFRGAVKQDVDRIIVTPGAADRPLWMSTELGSVIGQFKGFAVSAAQRVLVSGLQEKQAYTLYGMVMLVGMGVFVNQMKKDISGYEYGEESLSETILGGIDRSGVLGYFTDIEKFIAAWSENSGLFQGDRDIPARYVAGSLAGPTASKFMDLSRLFQDTTSGTLSEGTAGAFRRMLPLNNHPVFQNMLDQAQQAAR